MTTKGQTGDPVRVVEPAAPKGIGREKFKLQLEEIQKLLTGMQLKGRPKTSVELLRVCNELIGTLAIVNDGHTKEHAEDLFGLVGAVLARIYQLEGSFANTKNPVRTGLLKLFQELDSRLHDEEPTPYNPLDIRELTKSVDIAFSQNEPVPLADLKEFHGSGVYAVYYSGEFALYKPIADSNKNESGSWAIYVGKAVGEEAAQTGTKKKPSKTAIYDRLANHAESIRQVKNLNVEDFWVRYIQIEGLFVPLCETLLIVQNRPLWNDLVKGFGNKHMGVSRISEATGQQRTPWDMLHEGRLNRAVRPNKRFPKVEMLEGKVKEFLEKAQKERPSLSAAIDEAIELTEKQGEKED